MRSGSVSRSLRFVLLLTTIATLIQGGDCCLCLGGPVDSSYIAGAFSNGVSMAITPSGRLYVLDDARDEIIMFSPAGKEERRAGGHGWEGLVFDTPVDISAATDLEIYVADEGNNRIVRLDPALSFTADFPTEGKDVSFRYPRSVSLSGFGKLLIVDGEFGRIVELDQNRNVSRVFGGSSDGPGFLTDPIRVRVSGSKTVYVQHKPGLALFDTYGNFLSSIGHSVTGRFITFALYNDTVLLLDSAMIRIFDAEWNNVGNLPVPETREGMDPVSPVDLQTDGDWIYLLYPGTVRRMKYP